MKSIRKKLNFWRRRNQSENSLHRSSTKTPGGGSDKAFASPCSIFYNRYFKQEILFGETNKYYKVKISMMSDDRKLVSSRLTFLSIGNNELLLSGKTVSTRRCPHLMGRFCCEFGEISLPFKIWKL